jgi:hypothetical protein
VIGVDIHSHAGGVHATLVDKILGKPVRRAFR